MQPRMEDCSSIEEWLEKSINHAFNLVKYERTDFIDQIAITGAMVSEIDMVIENDKDKAGRLKWRLV